jgi:hypothetical protein
MIAGVATDTMVVSTRIMKKPMHSAKSAGHGSLPPVGSVVVGLADWVTRPLNTRPGTIASMSSFTGNDLMAGPPPTLLPEDPASADLVPGADAMDVVRRHPESPVAWATLATLAAEAEDDAVTIYAYARVGYHRSLDMLRRNGWKGHGPVPWEHEPNRGFLTCLALLALAARAIGEDAEWERCSEFLRDSSATAYAELLGDA